MDVAPTYVAATSFVAAAPPRIETLTRAGAGHAPWLAKELGL